MALIPFISGGVVLMLIGGTLAYMRSVPFTVFHYIKSRFIFTVEITHNDNAFEWLISWLHDHPSTQRSKNLVLTTRQNASGETIAEYSPIGNHFMIHRGRFIWIYRDREKMKENSFVSIFETVRISTFTRRRGFLEEVLEEARQVAEDGKRDKVVLYTLTTYGEWEEISRRTPRPLKSVILPDEVIDKTYHDLISFRASGAWYNGVGTPYRRGYLLHGKPGNGKTSLVFAIASELKMNLAILNLAAGAHSDTTLIHALSQLPKDCVLLIEDIDAAFNQRTAIPKDSKLTFSGLLNALDGVATAEGRIMFVTTNFKDSLDEALVRPGRIDVEAFIDNPAKEHVKQLFLKFFPNANGVADKFVASIPDGISAAKYQEHFLRYRDNVNEVITHPVEAQ